MRKSGNILSPDDAGLQTAAISEAAKEPWKRSVADDEVGL